MSDEIDYERAFIDAKEITEEYQKVKHIKDGWDSDWERYINIAGNNDDNLARAFINLYERFKK